MSPGDRASLNLTRQPDSLPLLISNHWIFLVFVFPWGSRVGLKRLTCLIHTHHDPIRHPPFSVLSVSLSLIPFLY